LILGNAKKFRNYLFEMSKIKEITRKGKIPKNGGNPRANPLSQSYNKLLNYKSNNYSLDLPLCLPIE
jgi:hypothetical protein